MASATRPTSHERSVAARLDRGRALPFAQAGGAKPIAARRFAAWGWVGGVYPSAPLKARTAAFDGHGAFTRAARSASIRFAVRSLSEATDREINKVRRLGWHLIHHCKKETGDQKPDNIGAA